MPKTICFEAYGGWVRRLTLPDHATFLLAVEVFDPFQRPAVRGWEVFQ